MEDDETEQAFKELIEGFGYDKFREQAIATSEYMATLPSLDPADILANLSEV